MEETKTIRVIHDFDPAWALAGLAAIFIYKGADIITHKIKQEISFRKAIEMADMGLRM